MNEPKVQILNAWISGLIALGGLMLPSLAHAQLPEIRDVGCFADNPSASPGSPEGHDLDGAALTDPGMTVGTCVALCFDRGFTYAGVQSGSRCFCGQSYGRFGAASSQCATPCAGDPAQLCGGENATQVYEIVTADTDTPQEDQPGVPEASAQPEPILPGTADVSPEIVQQTPAVFSVGKWPEGIAWDGFSIWVAESGRRRIARLDPDSGEVLQRVRVGRLPVGMTSTSDGSVYAAVATDRIIWRQPADDARGGVFAELRNYPQAIASDDDAVWVLTWVGGSSNQTQVVRMDLDTGRISRSAILPRNGFDLAVTEDTVWILHRYDGEGECALIGLDKTSLDEVSRTSFPGFTSFLAANDFGIFAAGAGFEENGLVVKFDPATGQEVARYGSDVIIAGIAADEQYVITADMAGEIQVFSADALSPVRSISLTNGPFRPQRLLAVDDRMFITTHQGDGDNGSLLVMEDWRP